VKEINMPENSKVNITEVISTSSRLEFYLELKRGFTRGELLTSLKELRKSHRSKEYKVEVFLPSNVEMDILFRDDASHQWDWTIKGQAVRFSPEHMRLFECIVEMHKILFS
jgi:hypothetical protein